MKLVVGVAALSFALVSGIVRSPAADESACEPTFRAIGDGPMAVQMGTTAWTLEAAVIGCRVKLTSLSASDMTQLSDVLRDQIRKQDVRFIRFRDEELRRDLASAINRRLGREAVTDLILFNVSRSENVDGER